MNGHKTYESSKHDKHWEGKALLWGPLSEKANRWKATTLTDDFHRAEDWPRNPSPDAPMTPTLADLEHFRECAADLHSAVGPLLPAGR